MSMLDFLLIGIGGALGFITWLWGWHEGRRSELRRQARRQYFRQAITAGAGAEAWAWAWAWAGARDKALSEVAEHAVQVLIAMGAPGTAFLDDEAA